MHQQWLLVAAILASLSYVELVNALATIAATGSKPFDSDGNQFFIKGKAELQINSHAQFSEANFALNRRGVSTRRQRSSGQFLTMLLRCPVDVAAWRQHNSGIFGGLHSES